MSVATFNAATFAGCDIVYFMGTFDLTSARITLPSSGSAWTAGNFITYASYPSDPAILDGGEKDVAKQQLLTTNAKNYVVVSGFTFQNVTSGGEGEALYTANSIVRLDDLEFTDWVRAGHDGAWVEVGGNGAQEFNRCIFAQADEEMISNHTSGTYSLVFNDCEFTITLSTGASWAQVINAPTSVSVNRCIFTGTTTLKMVHSFPAAGGSKVVFTACEFTYANASTTDSTYNYCKFNNSANPVSGKQTFNNCLFYGTMTYVYYSYSNTTPRAVGPTFNNCLFYSVGAVARFGGTATGGVVYINNSIRYSTNAIYKGSTADNAVTESNVSTDDPLCVNAETDFRLTASSPAINAGVDVDLTTDYAGNAISGNPDIGLYEYIPSGFTLPVGQHYFNQMRH